MKKIGEGWQYEVYDLENGRVLKKFKSLPKRTSIVLERLFPYIKYPLWKVPTHVRNIKLKAIRSFQLYEEWNLPAEWFANPHRLDGLDYEQDKITPLHDVLRECTLEEAKVLVNNFIDFNRKLLDHGVADKYFNIQNNFGLNSQGEIVLSDIGELLGTEEEIDTQVKARIWSEKYIAGRIKDAELRNYFVEEMDRNFRIEG